MAMPFCEAFSAMPLVAILRGIRPEEADTAANALVGAGFALIEVPLNSPDAFDTIERLIEAAGGRAAIGAGTVLAPADVTRVARSGGSFVVAPNFDEAVVRQALKRDLVAIPGVFTPTEIFAALASGAEFLKLFPAELIPPAAVKALRAVVPKSARLLPTGGIGADNLAAYLAAGADGAGFGSALYAPERSADDLRGRAEALVAAYRAARAG